MTAWIIPTRSHVVVIGCFGDANLTLEVEEIMQSIEIDAVIAPDEDEYARAGEALEAAVLLFEQGLNRRKEAHRDNEQFYALQKKWYTQQRSGNIDAALATCDEALVLIRKWTQKSDLKLGAMKVTRWVNFSLHEVNTLYGIATLRIIKKDTNGAEKTLNQALALLETYRSNLSERDAPRFFHLEATCLQHMGRVAELRKNYTAAALWMRKAVLAHRAKIEADPKKNAAGQITLANAITLLGEIQRNGGDYGASISSAEEAVEVAKSMPESVRDISWHKRVSGYYWCLAATYQAAGKGGEEIAAAKTSLAFAEDSRRAYSNNPRSRWEVADSRYRLMSTIWRNDKGRLQEVIALLREVADELASIRAVAVEGDLTGIDIQRIEGDRRRLLALRLGERAVEIRKKSGPQEEELNYLDQAIIEVEEAAALSAGMAADSST